MLSNSVIDRWIKFIEKNPNLGADNYKEADGIKYRGQEVFPWSTRTDSIYGTSIRTRQCFYWTLNGNSIVNSDSTWEECETVLQYVQIQLTKHLLKNPDETVVGTKQVREAIQAINQLGWVNL
mgnify:FL=1